MSSVFDPGKDDRNESSQMARNAQFDSFGASGAFGGGSFQNGQFTGNLGQLGGLFNQILGQATDPGFGNQTGLAGLQSAAADSTAGLQAGFQQSNAPQFNAPQQQQFQQGLQNQFFGQNQGLFDTLGQTAQQLGASQLDIARQIAAPGETRARQQNEQNLFGSGRLGTTGGGLQTEALLNSQNMADLQRQQMAFQQGQGVRGQAMNQLNQNIGLGLGLNQQGQALNQQAFGNALSGFGANLGAQQQQFGQDIGVGSFNAQRALDRFGVAGGLFDAGRAGMFDNINAQNSLLGQLGAIQGFGQNQFQQAMAAEQMRSNAALGGASQFSQNSQLAKSPIMEGLSMGAGLVGNFMTGGATGALGAGLSAAGGMGGGFGGVPFQGGMGSAGGTFGNMFGGGGGG